MLHSWLRWTTTALQTSAASPAKTAPHCKTIEERSLMMAKPRKHILKNQDVLSRHLLLCSFCKIKLVQFFSSKNPLDSSKVEEVFNHFWRSLDLQRLREAAKKTVFLGIIPTPADPPPIGTFRNKNLNFGQF